MTIKLLLIRKYRLKTKNIENSHISPTLVFLLGVLGLVSIMALDVHYWKIKIFAEGWPVFSLDYLTC